MYSFEYWNLSFPKEY